MVLVSVSKHYAAQFFDILFDISDIGNDSVHSRAVLFGESHAAVDDNHIARALYCRHILSNFPDSAEKGDGHLLLCFCH